MNFTAKQIAEYLQGTVEGDENASVHTFAKIEEGVPGAITFLANPVYEHYIYDTKASVVLVNKEFKAEKPLETTLIRVSNAYEALAVLMTLYEKSKEKKTGIHPLAFIAESARIGKDCYIEPFAFIGENVVIGNNTQVLAHTVLCDNVRVGEDCLLYPNVTIYHDCVVGNRVTLHAGCVIGADGFGFAPSENGYDKIPQIGIVTIEDDVEVGANSCVDRSTMGSTYVRRGVKLDNLVQIAHNVTVGENTVMSAQTGVAGSTKIGSWCMFGGQVGITGHAVIGDKVFCGAQGGIAGSIPKGHCSIVGSPAFDARKFARSNAVYKNLPEMFTEFQEMKLEIEKLKKQLTKQ